MTDSHARLQVLAAARERIALILTLLMTFLYFGFIALVAFARPMLALRVARIATLGLGVLAVLLGIAFKGQNVAFMVSLAFAIAASGNFPALPLCIFWRRCTTAGAVASMAVGTIGTLGLIALSPTVQVDILGRPDAWFPLKNPALATLPLWFAVGFVVSLLTADTAVREGYARWERRMHLGTVEE